MMISFKREIKFLQKLTIRPLKFVQVLEVSFCSITYLSMSHILMAQFYKKLKFGDYEGSIFYYVNFRGILTGNEMVFYAMALLIPRILSGFCW